MKVINKMKEARTKQRQALSSKQMVEQLCEPHFIDW